MSGRRPLRIVTTLHGTDIMLVRQDESFASLTRFGILESDAVTAVSAFLRDTTRQWFDIRRPIDVIPNFVDPARFRPALQRSGATASGPFRIAHISNFRPVKRSLDAVKAYVKSGKPIVGIRTASHGFQKYLEMDKDVFGGDYKGHFGKDIVCEVKPAEKGKDHAILKGVSPFKSNGSLYKNPNAAADVTVLLTGAIPNQSEPVAWVREKDGRRGCIPSRSPWP